MTKVEELNINDIAPYENNPRQNDAAVGAVAKSIKTFGFRQPIIVDKNGVIICGHTRVKAAAKLGIETVPVIRAEDLTPEQVKAYRIADNKVAELAVWDFGKLEEELSEIENIDMSDFGFALADPDEEQKQLEQKKREFEERMAAGELSEDSEEYQEFLAKFEPKKTTDDCYTPAKVYDAVAQYVSETYKVKQTDFVRPFVPGGDYEHFDYPKNCVVVDNPPFSILAEILHFYKDKNIPFFLFAPTLTLFSSSRGYASAICTGVQITYDNGAVVNSSFLTNLESEDIRFRSAPKLYAMIKKADEEVRKEKTKELPKYSYPLNVVTAPMLTPYSRYGIEFSVLRSESFPVSELDAQKGKGKSIYGKGYLISDEKKAEREKAERWELSDRELKIIQGLG